MKQRLAVALTVALLGSAGMLSAQQQGPAKKPEAKPAAAAPAAQTPAPQAQAPTQQQAQQQAAKPAQPAAKWTADQIKEAQEGLKRAKVYNGPVDGVLNAATRRAIRAYQRAHKLPVNGELSDSLLSMLKSAR
jgi:peptidoglycan hydrolase-like protein with peptidoglycan-binding domain